MTKPVFHHYFEIFEINDIITTQIHCWGINTSWRIRFDIVEINCACADFASEFLYEIGK
jgi:hypothetical protein